MKIKRNSEYFSVHTHSKYSFGDALPTVQEIVDQAAHYGQRAIGLTDHGNIAGSVELYQAAKRAGIKPFPGSELYFHPDHEQYRRDFANKEVKATQYHLGVLAYSTQGYHNLVNLSTLSHKNHFHKPRLDSGDLSELSEAGLLEGLAVTSGCYFGRTVQLLLLEGEDAAEQWLRTLQGWFGEGDVYIEMQNHLIDHDEDTSDDEVADLMLAMADRLSMPAIITQDSHYTHAHHRPLHETQKVLSSWSDAPEDATFPGDGFHMVDDHWMKQHHHEARYRRGIEGLDDLYAKNDLSIPVLDHYTYNVPQVVEDPQAELEKRVRDADLPKKYREKLEEELGVIGAAGMAGYLLLVAEITDYCRERGWLFQVRGSAAGSLVCFRLGITNVDPIHWDLRFERFLSKDRTKPPDVDLDIQHDKRQELIDWIKTKYFVKSIGTWMELGMTSEQEDEEAEGTGSLLRKYYTMARKMGLPTQWDQIPRDMKDRLYALDEMRPYSGMGKNAAGLVITSTEEEFSKWVPMHHSGTNEDGVAQYAKDDIEALGLVKLDVLGSKTLTIIAKTMQMLGKDIDEMLPVDVKNSLMTNESRPVYQDISKGITNGVFQLTGYTAQSGVQKLKPTNIHDIIAAMALYRPATMQSGATDDYVAFKHKHRERPLRHPLIERVVGKTHGIILYQEQVIDVLRELGMEADPLTEFLKAVKASNKSIGNAQQVIDKHMPWILNRAKEEGFDDDDVKWLDESFDAFGGYSFNKAHSTVYGLTAWRCAYLAHYHPAEFYCALLDINSQSSAKDKKSKESSYIKAVRDRGVRIVRPEINLAGAGWTVRATPRGDQLIVKGFNSVHGIGQAGAQELEAQRPEGGYRSVDHLIELVEAKKVSGSKDYLRHLKKTGERDYSLLNGVLGQLRDYEIMEALVHGESE